MIPYFKKQSNSFQILSQSILQFCQFIFLTLIVSTTKYHYFIGIFSIYYIFVVLMKIVVWRTISRNYQNIIKLTWYNQLKFVLLCDFREAYQFGKLKESILKMMCQFVYNFSSLLNFIFSIILFEDTINKNIRLINLEDENARQLIQFLITQVFIIGLIIANISFLQFFYAKINGSIGIFRLILAIWYIFSYIYCQIYLIVGVLIKDQLIAYCYLGYKIIVISLVSFQISSKNIYSLLRTMQIYPNYPREKQKIFIRKYLLIHLLFGLTLDIFPIISNVSSAYDKMVNHYTIRILRALNILEISSLFIYLIYFELEYLRSNKFFYFSMLTFSLFFLVNFAYIILHILYEIKFPRQISFIINEDQNSFINSTSTIQSNLLIDYCNPLDELIGPYIKMIEKNIFLQSFEVIIQEDNNNSISKSIKEKMKLLLIGMWQSSFFSNAKIRNSDRAMMENKQRNTYLYLNNISSEIVQDSLECCEKIIPRKLTLVFKEQLTKQNQYTLKKALIKHLLEIEIFEFIFLEQEVGDFKQQFSKDITTLKESQYSYQMQFTLFFTKIADTLINNPHHILFDLFEQD